MIDRTNQWKPWKRRPIRPEAGEPPLRAEMFSSEQLQLHAATLAGQHFIDPKHGPNRLLLRLADNEQVLQEAYDLLFASEVAERHIAPSGEWLLDNFYLIEQQIRATRLHLPRTYSRELPRLLDGPAAGFPRVYAIALELISHSDGRVNAESVSQFVSAYQNETPLTLGELWAVPIMLRLGLIENLRRVSEHITRRRRDRNLADLWADRFLKASEHPMTVLRVLADLAESGPPFSNPFVETFCSRLQGQSHSLATVQSWVQHRLADEHLTREQLQRGANQTQAADQVSIGNSIGSLRHLNTMDWRRFVETMSVVEATLRRDPTGVYGSMDFVTRDRYRHCVETLSRQSGVDEVSVAGEAVRLASAAAHGGSDTARTTHVGYYLIDKGQPELERVVRVRFSLRRFLIRKVKGLPVVCYVGSLLLVTAAMTLLFLTGSHLFDWHDWRIWLLLIPGIVSISQMAVTLVNLMTNLLVKTSPLPRLDFTKGIPPASRTMAVVPTLLSSPRDIADLLEGMELRYVGNQDPNLTFALLTDFRDASEEEQPEDAELVRLVREGIKSLNDRYCPEGPLIFHLFHRPRVWNRHERLWMGYERKRGKLEQFNELLRGQSREAFSEIISDFALLPTIRCVLTLDTDTALPRDAARKLIGTMSHPLNRARFDPKTGRVIEGYAILQPRTPISLVAANRSRFAQLSCGEAGIDPYTREVSDVYQDLFAEGTYVGKGIYDVDAFRQATAGRFPENLILSHDLVESNYARSALVSDVELHEDHPASFPAEMSRRHRWIRGDWQIAGWLLPRVLGPANKRLPNTLTALGWWKIFDNLRRSLVPPALLLLLLAGWFLVPDPTGFWTAFVLFLLLLPVLLSSLVELVKKSRDRSWFIHCETALKSLGRQLAEAALTLSSLPYRTAIHLDAIFVSAGRMLFTRRGLLLWHTPRYTKRNQCRTLADFFREMWISPVVAGLAIAGLAVAHPVECLVSGPVLLSWLFFPVIAWWISRPITAEKPDLTASQKSFLRSLARQTWRYFEVFANAEENWLAPDNFQEVPEPVVATRTSPTNIGMGLLADLAAHDFGYISAGKLVDLASKTLTTMERLERYRGHFLNWYDTRSLQPLLPLYVSSVDSGNLVGSLLTMRAGLLELKEQTILPSALFEGLRDTLAMLTPAAGELPRSRLQSPLPSGIPNALQWLRDFCSEVDALPLDGDPEQQWWTQALLRQGQDALGDLEFLTRDHPSLDRVPTLQELADASHGAERALQRIRQIDDLAQRCTELALMDFSFLHDPACDLLTIGYNISDRRLDPSYYDLLASEARMASYILVAQGHVNQDHWFALGRQLTTQEGAVALLSWSGSMFEYLMPRLLMPTYEHTLLDETYRAVVARQIEYGKHRGVPWGISESCYNLTDAQGTYQYSAFGVPGLGLKRGLADDLVIAPYASALALMVLPKEACRNLERLAADGFQGTYGLYEAIDFTPSRVPRFKAGFPLRSYMAHHQGMSLLSLLSVLMDQPMQRRFLADPYLKASELLLCERIPKGTSPLQPHAAEVNAARLPPVKEACTMRVFSTPHTAVPEVHLLSNGRLHIMATNAGGGNIRWNNLAVTRWREDATSDGWGLFCYLRDTGTGSLWSAAYQPACRWSDHYEAIFVEGRAEYRRRDEEIDSHMEIAVSPEDDVEVRRITLTNLSTRRRSIELTSYAEVVLASHHSDLAHPAFSNLFVQTEILGDSQAILCTRRARAPGENPPWMFHLMTTQGTPGAEVSYETNRATFIGRARSAANPAAFDRPGPLSNTEGSVLDPIVSIRQSVLMDADTSANWHLVSGVAESREAALVLIGRYCDPNFAARAFEMAWSHSQLELHQMHATEAEAQLYARLASSMVYANPLHRAAAAILTRNRRGQAGLWAFGISGDLPILLMRIADVHRINLVKHVLQAHAYWRGKGLEVDLVILNEDFSGYRQVLQDRILNLIASGTEAHRVDKPGGIFLRRSEDLTEEDRILLQSVARVILTDSAETLTQQVTRRSPPDRKVPRLTVTRTPATGGTTEPVPYRDLLFFNGIGGFTQDGREYVVQIQPGKATPAPWSNVLANDRMGSVVSESGAAYTWVDNAHEFRLTPWNNDPISDPSGEAFYLRDEETGQFWSPAPLPAPGNGTYTCRHGFGYSVFEYTQSGINTEVWTYVAVDSPVKFVVVRVRNHSGRARRLSVTGYWEWVLGQWRHSNLMHIVTEVDPASGTLYARNDYNREFAGKTVFVNVNEAARTVTGNRTEFLGRNGTTARPAAMWKDHLSGRTGASLDPCAALQAPFDLAKGQERELVFLLGAGNDAEEAHQLVRRFSGSAGAKLALESVWEFWKQTLGTVHAETPDPALNILVNGWLEYQTLACRYWARSGYYQSGGAYGFRDQLQDTTALLNAAPWTAREHLLRAAARQFIEGDVQHWWHPHTGRGVRTHFSDDFLWLPYCACRYVKATGDTGVLDVQVPFLEGRAVNADEESYYDLPRHSDEEGTLYEHCVRAITRGLRFGSNGLPLIGCGDWNDGMNLVGAKGKGESVWLAFFLYDVLRRFSGLARSRNDVAFADRCTQEAEQLQLQIEANGWDGGWYRRAYFDDGTPLGSATNEECQIDSIAQSWAVLSGAGNPERARLAMERVDQRLVRRDAQLILLFDPPFDKSALEPGYIKGYIPGVRENGGQYTHAAIWAAMAFAEMGETEKAFELFSMLNPIRHATNPEGVSRYKIEPYVAAADVYSVAPNIGRGGWSWYTGSSGWMYRLIVETFFGLHLEMDQLHLNPHLPEAWESFKIHYRYRDTFYHFTITRSVAEAGGRNRLVLDGNVLSDNVIPLVDDGREHVVEMSLL
ncbi:MAG: cyclic beta 1-2 glucan synthetase [Akkermansiaceae bacterium]|nr:cyclic beta 1-2 glucan synthetase [Verrucomicrobiae bacterium]MCP5552609.1 cyclic beta 1-2 glucan synthetase [Akkermansiaceae bacterium]